MDSHYKSLICEDDHVDKLLEKEVLGRIPDENSSVDAADLFSQLADSTRVRLLCMLSISDLCVCEMADMLHISQPAVSHHLRSLRQTGIVRFRKQGKRASYYLSPDDNGKMVRKLLKGVFSEMEENSDA